MLLLLGCVNHLPPYCRVALKGRERTGLPQTITMLRSEKIRQWHALIASYQRHCHEFDYFCLYALFDSRENAIASELVYVPFQWVHPPRSVVVQEHLCVKRFPASIWQPKDKASSEQATYLHEARAFSALLLTNTAAKKQSEESCYGELPHMLRQPFPPWGVIDLKLYGVKHCREFALDFLALLDNPRNGPLILPRYLRDASSYLFNWCGKTYTDLCRQMPPPSMSQAAVWWFPLSKRFVASIGENRPIRILRYCMDALERDGQLVLVNALRDKISARPSTGSGANARSYPIKAAQAVTKSTAFSTQETGVKNQLFASSGPIDGGWFGVCIYDSARKDRKGKAQ